METRALWLASGVLAIAASAVLAEQRKRMEALLGKSSPGADGAKVMKTRITPDQVATFEANTTNQAQCTRELFEKSVGELHIRTRCQSGMVMDLRATYQGERAYESVITATVPGRPAPMVTHVKARWLGPTCEKPAP